MSSGPSDVSAPRRALGRFNAAAAVLLLVAGGMVTSTNSGMAVPDWPLSYGQWLPRMTGGVFFEHGHRMIAAFIGLMILIMAFYTQFDESRPGVRRLAWWTLFGVSLQGVLGGVTVLFNLPVAVSAAHATLGQTVFCLLVVMADLVGGEPAPAALDPLGRLPALSLLAVAALWCQLVMGAVMRHGGSGIAPHLAGAAVAALAAGALGAAGLARREPAVARPAGALLALLAVQLTLGLATADFRTEPLPRANPAMIAAATAHLVVGALLLGAAVLVAFRLHRMKAASAS
ncbi:MAG TPA: COX15/CtaA family protein [Elusimicrobiota bacterium]|nr:COX15/CtaA family protein [Elusimicrobiota bacterium]